ncbi:hypothetical protein [Streptomyces uncialis]|uniref:hypothetical protein n=1 Tax=Streptomyces uncialis TaxID=1048205 RepID=UPI00379AEC60
MTEIMNAWEYDGGELGFRRGREVHVTDWGQGKVKALTEWAPKLPWADPDCIWLYEQSSACGVIKDSEVWFSDHPDIYKIHDRYPSLPSGW